MRNMTKKTKALLITAVTLTCVLVGAVVLGTKLGIFTDRNSVSGAGELNLGTFTVPASEGTLGSETNPFVVLEIVPSEDMAQFGYLVADQEPIDLSSVPEDEMDTVRSLIKTQLAVSSTSYGTPFKAGFYKDIEDILNKYSHKESTANQYGYYLYHEDADQAYDLTLDTSAGENGRLFVTDDAISSYAYVESKDAEEVGATGVRTAEKDSVNGIPLNEIGTSALPGSTEAPDLYDESGNLKIVNDAGEYIDTIYAERTPGQGALSDEIYEKITAGSTAVIGGATVDRTVSEASGVTAEDITSQSPYGGEYSFDYKYVGEGNGDTEYGIISGGTGAGGDGTSTIETGYTNTRFVLEANGYYLDMSGNIEAGKLCTEDTEDSTGEGHQYFRLTEATGKTIDGRPAYYIYTGESDYTEVLTAQFTGATATFGGKSITLEDAGDGYYYLKYDGKYWYYSGGWAYSSSTYSNSDSYKYSIVDGKYLKTKYSSASHPYLYWSNYSDKWDFNKSTSSASTITSITYTGGYVAEGTYTAGDATQLFALEPYTLNGSTYNRIYCSVNGTAYYLTGQTKEGRILLQSEKLTATAADEEITVAKVSNADGTDYLTVQPVSAGNATVDGVSRETYWLYTQDSEYKQAITYADSTNGQTGLSATPGENNRFYRYTDTATSRTYYRTVSDNSGYNYLYMDGSDDFALYKVPEAPGTAEVSTSTEEYVLISNSYTTGYYSTTTYSHLLKLVSAGTGYVNGATRELYYVYTDTSGFESAVYYADDGHASVGTPNGTDKYKFYIDGSHLRTALSEDDAYYYYLVANKSGSFRFEHDTSDAGSLTRNIDSTDYRTITYNSHTVLLRLEVSGSGYYVYNMSEYTGTSPSRYTYDDSVRIFTFTSSNKLVTEYTQGKGKDKKTTRTRYLGVSSDGELSAYEYESYGDVAAELEPAGDITLATITSGTYSVTAMAVPYGDSSTHQYKLYMETYTYSYYYGYTSNGYHQIYYDGGSVGTESSTDTDYSSAAYIFTLETIDGSTYLKLTDTSAQQPYLYAVDDSTLGFTVREYSIPGSITAGTDTVITADYIGLQLFERIDEADTLTAYFRYILNDMSELNSTYSNRYLEIGDSGRLVQNSTTIYTDNDNQLFAFVETAEGSGRFYIYTGHSNFTKVLTLSSTAESATIGEAVRDDSKEALQVFTLYGLSGSVLGSIDNTTDYQRIRTANTVSVTTGNGWRQTTNTYPGVWDVNQDAGGSNVSIIQYRDKAVVNNSSATANQKFKLVDAGVGGTVLGFYAKAGGSYQACTGLKYPVSTGSGYTYTNSTSTAQKVKIDGTEREYTVPAGESITIYLGDYDRTYYPECKAYDSVSGTGDPAVAQDDMGPVWIENEEGRTYGNFNYSKYVLKLVSGGYKYAFTMTKLSGEDEGHGHYEWIGYGYDECYGSEKLVTDTSQYPASVLILAATDAGVGETDKKEKYSQILSCQSDVKVYTLYEAGTETRSDDSFKKYAIGLAYIDQDYTQGLADAHYEFDGWYTDPYCMYKFNPETKLTSDITLYARWACTSPGEVNFKVTFDGNAYELKEDGSGYATDEEGNKIVDTGLAAATVPATVEKVRKGNRITEPETTPIRSGYIFAGWYDDADCVWATEAERQASKKQTHDFSAGLTKDITLYAGWVQLDPADVYTLKFNFNTSFVGMSTSEVQAGMPYAAEDGSVEIRALDSVTNYARNGRLCTLDEETGRYIYSDITMSAAFYDSTEGVMAARTPVMLTKDGEATEYVFAGWYYYATCEDDYRFEFNTTVTGGVHMVDETDAEGHVTHTITLYAKWIKADTLCTVSFDSNIPDGSPEAENLPSSLKVTYGEAIGQEVYKDQVTDLNTTRESDVEVLLDNYHVRVITVTPSDLNNTSIDNLKLVDRANLIVINQTCSDEMRKLWQNYRRTTLFTKDAAYYSEALKEVGTTGKVSTFVDNDLNWKATERLFNRIAGVGCTACPVIFDYTAYTGALSDASAKQVTQTAVYSGGETIETSAPGSSNNIYKLYLMTQQMNPITLYNAYINDTANQNSSNEIAATSDGTTAAFNAVYNSSTNPTGWISSYTVSGTTGSTRLNYWSKYTLVPYNAMTQGDHTRDGLGVIGVTDAPEISAAP